MTRFFKIMGYITKKFNATTKKTIDAFKSVFESNLGNCNYENGIITSSTSEETHFGSKTYSFTVMFLEETGGKETAVYIEFETNDNHCNCDSELRDLVSFVEDKLQCDATFCNYSKKDFVNGKVVSNANTPDEALPDLMAKEKFEESIKKIISQKGLLDAKLISKKEYHDVVDPLIEEL